MNYEINKNGDQAICTLSGELTFNDHDQFRRMLDEALDSGVKEVVLDMGSLTFIDSAGMGMLLVGNDKASTEKWQFSVERPQGQVLKMLDLAKLSQVISIS